MALLPTVSASGASLAASFKSAAAGGQVAAAIDYLGRMSIMDGLVSALDLAKANEAAYKTVFMGESGSKRGNFVIRTVWAGYMPYTSFSGVGAAEYAQTRLFIMKAWADRKAHLTKWWNSQRDNATTTYFYPEAVNYYSDYRTIVCNIALDHARLGPGEEKQAALFSLGGFYDFKIAKDGTKPGVGTTCVLFARSVLQASGINVINKQTSVGICNVPGGLLAELPRTKFGWVGASGWANGARPQRGDIFHIRGDNFHDKTGLPGKVDSTHVGVIVDVLGDRKWLTVEGGASDHVTQRKERELITVTSKHGSLAFKDDTATNVGRRPLQGWYSIDGFAAETFI
jgi:hypothetical protein